MATDTNSVLQFGFRDDESFLGLDDIQVIPLASAAGPPIIATQPVSQIAVQGGAATFSVLSSGDLPLAYQWQFDGDNLDDATNATLVLTNLNSAQSSSFYSVLVFQFWRVQRDNLQRAPDRADGSPEVDHIRRPAVSVRAGARGLRQSELEQLLLSKRRG